MIRRKETVTRVVSRHMKKGKRAGADDTVAKCRKEGESRVRSQHFNYKPLVKRILSPTGPKKKRGPV